MSEKSEKIEIPIEDQQIFIQRLDNGLTLLAEQMDWLESAAFALLMPSGCRFDPEGRQGLANLVCDMAQRGAGDRDSRQLLHDLENLGVDYSGSVSNSHLSFGGATLAERMSDALEVFADIVQRPHLPESQLDDSKMVCYQEILALEDDLARRAVLDLRRRHYPMPLGRDHYGNQQSVSQITIDDVRRHVARHFVPDGSILAVAGNFQWPELREHVTRHFGSWQGEIEPAVETTPAVRGYNHLEHESSQTHIVIGYEALPPAHDDFYLALAAANILGDGASSRLFTEVREERGLCYSVGASYHALRDEAYVQCYSGTTTDRAQQTLDVMLEQVHGLAEGIRPQELQRLQARFKSTRIMQQESSPARSGSIASQWYHLRRVRTLEETAARIDALSVGEINRYLAEHPPRAATICTLGESPLEIHVELS